MRHSEKIPQIPEKCHSYSLRVTFRVGISGVHSVCFKGKSNLECIWIYVTDIISRQHFGDRVRSTTVVLLSNFLYPATLKSAGYYVVPSIQNIAFECPSVCPSAHRFHSLLGAFLTNFLQTCYES